MSDDTFDPTLELEAAEQAALDAVLAPPELTRAEWSRLHDAIMSAARPALAARTAPASLPARRAQRRTWRWFLPALPLAAAALLLVVLRDGPGALPPLEEPEAALLADVSEQEFRMLVSGQADAASLLLLAVQDEAEQ